MERSGYSVVAADSVQTPTVPGEDSIALTPTLPGDSSLQTPTILGESSLPLTPVGDSIPEDAMPAEVEDTQAAVRVEPTEYDIATAPSPVRSVRSHGGALCEVHCW
jgi:hypothetical protein